MSVQRVTSGGSKAGLDDRMEAKPARRSARSTHHRRRQNVTRVLADSKPSQVVIYKLNNAGNRETEAFTDKNGVLAKAIGRTLDGLGRLKGSSGGQRHESVAMPVKQTSTQQEELQ
jgi:hypothetical protein